MVALREPQTVSIRDLIRNDIDLDPKADNVRIAQRILYQVEKDDLLPLVVAEVANVRRENVLRRERSVLPKLVGLIDRRRPNADELRARIDRKRREYNELRTQPLDLGDGTTVKWGKATIDQLKLRRAMLLQQSRGINATITQITDVIEALEQAGVSCLDDLR